MGFKPAVPVDEPQGDLARLTNTLRAVIEVNETCWRGDDCELSNGVRGGLQHVAAHTQRHSEIAELRVSYMSTTISRNVHLTRNTFLVANSPGYYS